VAVLLDTHLILWAAFQPECLSAKASKLLRVRESPQAFILATIWEVAIKTSLGRSDFSADPQQVHQALLAEGFVELPIHASHIVRVASLPWMHRDPFDRLLVAQALEERMTLLTANKVLKDYGRFVRMV
jgi:PIN domain nuclease of toxin-antitoxin system